MVTLKVCVGVLLSTSRGLGGVEDSEPRYSVLSNLIVLSNRTQSNDLIRKVVIKI